MYPSFQVLLGLSSTNSLSQFLSNTSLYDISCQMAQNESSIKTSSMKKTSETYSTLSKGTERHLSISSGISLWKLVTFTETKNYVKIISFKDKVVFIVGGRGPLTFYHLKLLFKIWNTVNENHSTKVRQFQTYVYSLADMPKTKGRFERFTELLTEHAHWLSFQSLSSY